MKATLNRLIDLLHFGQNYFSETREEIISQKPHPDKWSKKEILGHLIDSGINNLQRFTEIQFEQKPYKIRRYNQDELVKANNYQNSDIDKMVTMWISINNRILKLMKLQTEQTLKYEVDLGDGKITDLKFLMMSYVEHMEHHMNQIKQ